MADNKKIVKVLAEYYHGILLQHGVSPQGVGWRDDSAQFVRFDQLLKILKTDNNFIINDLGCGYGVLCSYMLNKGYHNFKYIGYDLSSEMVKRAVSLHGSDGCSFYMVKSVDELKEADYTVASGIFNLNMGYSNKEWYEYVISTLDAMDAVSRNGFSFNCLTKYSDKHLMKAELYYADPCKLFDHCKRRYSKNVALLHDYNIYDFTILVRKN